MLEELQALGAEECAETRAGVSCSAKLEVAYRSLLWSRLGSRVLLLLQEGEVQNEEQLYSLAAELPWEDHFSPRETFAVDADTLRSPLRNSAYAALKVKDAVADRFRKLEQQRPSVDTENPQIRIRLHLSGEKALLYLDLSGESLHRRGYRLTSTAAPLRETSAAGMLIRARWPEIAAAGGGFFDPMCGSGTLPIEAAMMAADIAPGLLRKRFGTHSWKKHDEALWRKLVAEAETRKTAGLKTPPLVAASDINAEAVEAARSNVARAELSEVIELRQSDFRRLAPSSLEMQRRERGLVAVNPPYGIRLKEQRQTATLYKELGRWLAEHFSGFRAAVLAPDKETARQLGLHAQKLNTLYNGNLKVYLAGIELGPENRFAPRRPGADLPAPDKDPTSGVNTLINRLKKNRRALKNYLKNEGVTCYRIYDADIPQYAAAIDVYEDEHFVIQEYAPPKTVDPESARQHLQELQGAVVHYYGADPQRLYIKQRRRQKRSDQYERSDGEGERYIVKEGGLKFFVNFTDYLDTGIFLDHRITRAMLRDKSEGAHFLNLFAYTCTASVYAAAGGARRTVSVDTSNTYLEWGQSNFELNRLSLETHRFARREVFTFLRTDAETYDLIFIDPPTFSNRKGREADFDVQRDHALLIDLAARRLAADGEIVFSNNYRRFELDAALYERYAVHDITAETIPPDFARNQSIHCTYLLRLR